MELPGHRRFPRRPQPCMCLVQQMFNKIINAFPHTNCWKNRKNVFRMLKCNLGIRAGTGIVHQTAGTATAWPTTKSLKSEKQNLTKLLQKTLKNAQIACKLRHKFFFESFSLCILFLRHIWGLRKLSRQLSRFPLQRRFLLFCFFLVPRPKSHKYILFSLQQLQLTF